MFQFGEGVRKSFNNAGVDGAVDGLVWSSKILGAFQGRDVVAPELGLVGKSGILSVKIEMHFA